MILLESFRSTKNSPSLTKKYFLKCNHKQSKVCFIIQSYNLYVYVTITVRENFRSVFVITNIFTSQNSKLLLFYTESFRSPEKTSSYKLCIQGVLYSANIRTFARPLRNIAGTITEHRFLLVCLLAPHTLQNYYLEIQFNSTQKHNAFKCLDYQLVFICYLLCGWDFISNGVYIF